MSVIIYHIVVINVTSNYEIQFSANVAQEHSARSLRTPMVVLLLGSISDYILSLSVITIRN
jgi:hypothetical protein